MITKCIAVRVHGYRIRRTACIWAISCIRVKHSLRQSGIILVQTDVPTAAPRSIIPNLEIGVPLVLREREGRPVKTIMEKKLSDVAILQSGLVLSRKEARAGDDAIEYKRLNLRSVEAGGKINLSTLEAYYSRSEIPPAQLTKKNDIVIRLLDPLYPVLIGKSEEGLVVPSQLAIIRVTNNMVLPAFLCIFLSRPAITEKLTAEDTHAFRTISVGAILNTEIPILPLEIQNKLIEVYNINNRRIQLYHELIEQEQLYTDLVIEKMIGGHHE